MPSNKAAFRQPWCMDDPLPGVHTSEATVVSPGLTVWGAPPAKAAVFLCAELLEQQRSMDRKAVRYSIRVTRGGRQHMVERTYTSFAAMRQAVVEALAVQLPEMPPKSTFRKIYSESFMDERMRALKELLAAVMEVDRSASLPVVHTFLGLTTTREKDARATIPGSPLATPPSYKCLRTISEDTNAVKFEPDRNDVPFDMCRLNFLGGDELLEEVDVTVNSLRAAERFAGGYAPAPAPGRIAGG